MRRSFSAAAEALSFTQPAVSQHVARLEKALDAPLLSVSRAASRSPRRARRSSATPSRSSAASGVPRPRCAGWRAPSGPWCASARSSPPRPRSSPRPSGWSAPSTPASTSRLRRSSPIPACARSPPAASRRDRHRVALPFPWPATPGVELRHIFDDLMLVVLPEGHPLALRPSLPLEELTDEPWLLGDVAGTCPDSNIVLRACQEAGFEPRSSSPPRTTAPVQGMVAVGDGRRADPLDGHREHPPRRRGPAHPRPGADAAHPRRRRRDSENPVVESLVEALRAAARSLGTVSGRCTPPSCIAGAPGGPPRAHRRRALRAPRADAQREGRPSRRGGSCPSRPACCSATAASSRSGGSATSASPRTWPSTCCSATSPRC